MLYLAMVPVFGGWRGSRDLTRRRPRSRSLFVTRSRFLRRQVGNVDAA
jgi:hypothetical protein